MGANLSASQRSRWEFRVFKAGKRFDARLKLENGEVRFDFEA